MSWNRKLFFALDKLHISAAERYFVLTLLLLLTVASLFRICAEPEGRYESGYYDELEKELKARKEMLASSEQEILKRYGLWADSGVSDLSMKKVGFEEAVPDSAPSNTKNPRLVISPNQAHSLDTSSDSVEKGVLDNSLQVHERDNNTGNDKRILINKASVDALTQLPGIGPVIAGRIVQYRSDHGPFTSINDLRNVKGIGEKRLEDILPYIKL